MKVGFACRYCNKSAGTDNDFDDDVFFECIRIGLSLICDDCLKKKSRVLI